MSITEGLVAGLNIKANRELLAEQKRKTDADLLSKGYDPKTLGIIAGGNADVEKAQNQLVLQNLKAMQGKLAAQDSDKALVDYASTGDANYLQNALNNNPVLKKAWNDKGVQAVSNVDFGNDGKLLSQAGFNPAEYDTAEKQDVLKKNVYKTFDGQNWNIGLLNNVVRDTGATTRLGDRSSQVLLDNHQEFRDFMSGPRSSPNTAEGHKYQAEIMDAAAASNVPPNLIAAMLNQESGGNPNAVSNKGAKGLMQLTKGAAAEVGIPNPDTPAENIMAGALYMAKQLKTFNGDTRLALAAYNAGPGAVAEHNGIPPYEETQNYVNKITQNYAAGESYYNAGQDVVSQVPTQGQPATVKDVTPQDGINREGKYYDNRIATIQQFVQGNANAAKGSTNALEEQKVANDTATAEAQKLAALVKLKTEGSTANQKDIQASRDETTSLINNFGGEEQFNNTDFSDPKNFNKAWPQVVAINKYEGTTLTEADKKSITDIRGLITLSDPASKLSAEQTGLLDQNLAKVKKTLSDSVGGVKAASAYNAFKNSIRHALYGSALTPGEIDAFNSAYGNTGQKLGPVLEQFQVALSQVKSKLDSTAQLSNPYTSKVLLGADQAKLVKIQDALQSRIDYIQGLSGVKPEAKTNEIQGKLDQLFGGGK